MVYKRFWDSVPKPIRWLWAHAVYYPSRAWNNVMFSRGHYHRWDRIAEHVWLGSVPSAPSHVRDLHALGVRAVVNVCEEFYGLDLLYRELGIEQLHVPTVDFSTPASDDLKRAAAFVEKHVALNVGVYIHCKAGRGRSVAVALAWLILYKHMTPEQAFLTIQRARPHINTTVHLRPQITCLAV